MLETILPFCLFTFFSLVFVTWFLVIRVKKGGCPLAVIIKSIASILFVFGAIYALFLNGAHLPNILIVFGLILAMFGDIILDLKVSYKEHNKIYLNTGIASFSVSSALYIVATILLWCTLEKFLIFGMGSFLISLIFAVVVFLMSKPLKLDFTEYKPQVFIYSLLVGMAAILSLGITFLVPGFALFAIGAFLILVSDLVLSMMYFGGKADSKILCIINHILYYVGELLIMSYLFFQMF